MRKMSMEQKIKGFTYFNKTSKESKLRIKVIGNSRWSIPVTDLVKPSYNLQYLRTPGLET